MKTFRQFLKETIKNYRDSWYGINVAGRGVKNNSSTYDDEYMRAEPEKLDYDGKTVGWKHKLIPNKNVISSAEEIIPKDDTVIHRGMSHDEYQNIMKTGKISSMGSGNIGSEQEGLTYFTTDPASADAYSNSFAKSSKKPTHKKSAYIVSIRKPPESKIKKVLGTAEHEIGVVGEIPADNIVAVYRGQVIAHEPQINTLSDQGHSLRTISAYSRLHWQKIK